MPVAHEGINLPPGRGLNQLPRASARGFLIIRCTKENSMDVPIFRAGKQRSLIKEISAKVKFTRCAKKHATTRTGPHYYRLIDQD